MMPITLPEYAGDLFSEGGITSPYGHYATIRELGPVVALPSLGLLAVGRYADVKSVLLDHRTFVSGEGTALNDEINIIARGTTLASDAPLHPVLRGVIAAPLQPRALDLLRDQIQDAADQLIDRLVARGSFDGIIDLARFLPVLIVSNLIGLPEDGRENMLEWAAATFDCIGPDNARYAASRPKLMEMLAYTVESAGPDRVKPDSWAARIYAAADAGVVERERIPLLLLDYLGPSLDTTIFATGHLLDLFGRHPDQWAMLRADPMLAVNAIDETIRLETPIRGFTRVAAADTEIDGVAVPAGSRVLLLYASANRDERKWNAPDRFNIARRNAREHLGFGLGRHVCAGQHLAKLEMMSLLIAMVRRFASLEVGPATIQSNNILRGFSSLPVTVTG